MREHKLRSGLTILGIVVGVATVIAMVAIVTGFNNNVIGNFQAFGASRIEFMKYKPRFGGPGPQTEEERRRRNLTMDDVLAIRKACPEAAAVSALVGYFDAEIHVKNGNLEANNPYVLGADEYYPTATAYTIALGRFFTAAEVEHGALEVVLGADVREAIFPPRIRSARRSRSTACATGSSECSRRRGSSSATRRTTRSCVPYRAFEHQFAFQVRQDGVRISAVPRRPEDIGVVIEKGDRGPAHAPEDPVQQAQRFRGQHAGPADRPVPGDHGRRHGRDDPDRPDLARRRRRGRHEHHARLRHAEDAGDRHPEGGRARSAATSCGSS